MSDIKSFANFYCHFKKRNNDEATKALTNEIYSAENKHSLLFILLMNETN